jgi:hypothetical protein
LFGVSNNLGFNPNQNNNTNTGGLFSNSSNFNMNNNSSSGLFNQGNTGSVYTNPSQQTGITLNAPSSLMAFGKNVSLIKL